MAKKEPLDNKQILDIINVGITSSTGSTENDSITSNRKDALSYYLGDKGETVEGRSSVVSTDVADAIEWIMPEVVKAFTQNNEVVTFDPVSSEDCRQAELESRFVYDTIMKDNDGFITFYEFFKDALMQKNGFLKVFYENTSNTQKEDYIQLTEPEYEMLISQDDVEVTGLSTEVISDDAGNTIEVYNVNVIRRRFSGRVDVSCVAPEDIIVHKLHNSVSLKDCKFIAHQMYMTRSELIESGFDKELVDSLTPVGSEGSYNNRKYRFDMQGESTQGNIDIIDDSLETYEISECYLFMDVDGDGIAERCKVTVGGFSNPSVVLEVEEVERWPFISATPIIMSHKLFGLSIYDRLKEIQDQKTAVWRNVLDNMYLKNNQRTVVVEGQVNLDDLLVSRPGGIIRAKTQNAVTPYQTPDLGADAYRMMDYLDQVRSGRSGVSPEGSIHDSAMGDSVGSQGLEQLLSQKEELVGLMIRVFAETGIKPLCNMVRELLVQNKDVVENYEFKGEWVEVNPSTWEARTKSTVRVGTGSGNRKEQAAAIVSILSFQEKILQNPNQTIVTEANVYNALNDYAKFSGMPGAGKYFLDPNSPEGQENAQRVQQAAQQQQEAELKEKQQLAQTQEAIAKAETIKAQAAYENVGIKAQLENAKNEHEAYKIQADAQIKALQQRLSEDKQFSDAFFKERQLDIEQERVNNQMTLGLLQYGQNSGESDDRQEKSEAGD